jgi:O-antigen ligase
VRDERALRRLLLGLFILTGILMIGVIFPNKFSPFFPVDETGMKTGEIIYSGFTRLYYQGDMIFFTMIPVTLAGLAMDKKKNQIWRIILLGFLVFWAFKSGYRQYWITLPTLCFLLIGLLPSIERLRLIKRLAPVVLICFILIIVVLLVQPNQVERFVYVITNRLGSLLNDPLTRENSLQWRLIETRYALNQFSSHPILGVGLGNRFRPPMVDEFGLTMYDDWTSRFLENGYLWIAVMMGLVGIIPFLWLCVTYPLQVYKHYREIISDELRAVFLGFGLGFLGLAVCNFATPFFVIGGRLIFFPIAMAICEIILRLNGRKLLNQSLI